MANKKWYETLADGDCISPYTEWNYMVDYIQHSACTDFTIHSTCTSTSQAFRFTHDGTTWSTMFGGNSTGDDLTIRANDVDIRPYINMYGDAQTLFDTTTYFEMQQGGEQMFKFNLSGTISYIYGSDNTGDDMWVYANESDTYPYMFLSGNSGAEIAVNTDHPFRLYEAGNQMFRFEYSAGVSELYGGSSTSQDLEIYANSTDANPVLKLNGAGHTNLYLDNDKYFYIFNDKASPTEWFRFVTGTEIWFMADRAMRVDDDEAYFGHGAGDSITSGAFNTLIGNQAGNSLTNEDRNVFVGYEAGQAATSADATGVGYGALKNVTGSDNSALGFSALNLLTDGVRNTAVGDSALLDLTTGDENVAVGARAGDNTNNNINKCIFIGNEAGRNNAASNIIAIGYQTLYNNTAVGVNNTAVGYLALADNTDGYGHTAVGNEAIRRNTTGNNNTGFGYLVLTQLLTGSQNVAVGREALEGLTVGSNNVAVGYQAGESAATDISNCVYIGAQAGESNTAGAIVAIGYQTLDNNTGAQNVGVGHQVLDATVTGNQNTGIGYQSLTANTSGLGNSALGYLSLGQITLGERNVGIGRTGGYGITTGDYNVAIGYSAAEGCAANLQNAVIIGYNAGYGNDGNSVVLIGHSAGQNNTGNDNVGIGYNTLNANITGINNTAVGTKAGDSAATNISGCIYLGYEAGSNNTRASTLVINNNNSVYPLIEGRFDTDEIRFGNNDAAWNFQFTTAGVVHTIDAGNVAGNELILKGSGANAYPYIHVIGGGNLDLYTSSGGYVNLYEAATKIFYLGESGGDVTIGGALANADIYLSPNGTGLVKFGTYAAKGAEAFAGFITMKDSGGTPRKVMVCA